MVKLYTLSDPSTGEVRYVGKTVQSLNCRLATHICRNRCTTHTEAWVKSLKLRGMKPKIELLCEVDDSIWESEEQFYIMYFKWLGFRLTNHSIGGDRSNLGSRWKRSAKTQERLDAIIDQRNYDLALYNSSGELICRYPNVRAIVSAIGYNYKTLSVALYKNVLVGGQYYVSLYKGPKIITTKRRRQIISVIDSQGLVHKLGSKKEAAQLVDIDASTLTKKLKVGPFMYNNYMILL